MARSQQKSRRKPSSGRYHSSRSKKKYELVNNPTNTKMDTKVKIRKRRILGGNVKYNILTTNMVNVADKKGKTQKTELVNVIENPANPNLVGRNILTKGAIVETKLGKAKITGRPGQESSVNAVLM